MTPRTATRLLAVAVLLPLLLTLGPLPTPGLDAWHELLQRLPDGLADPSRNEAEAAANVLLLLPLAFLLAAALPRVPAVLVVAACVAASVAVEAVQLLLLADRTPSARDVAANSLGALVGVAASRLLGRLRGGEAAARPSRGLAVRLTVLAVVLGTGALAAVGVYAGRQVLDTRSDLTVLRTELLALAADPDGPGADGHLQRATAAAAAARADTDSALWSLAARLPRVGPAAGSVRNLAVAGEVLTTAVAPPLLAARQTLDPAALRRPDGSLDLARLSAVGPALAAAAADLGSVQGGLDVQPAATGVAEVDRARRELLEAVDELTPRVQAAADAVALAPGLLGADGPRRWFVAIQQPAEARPTGGQLVAYAVVTTDRGTLTVDEQGSNLDLRRRAVVAERPRDLPADLVRRHPGAGIGTNWLTTNLSPHFPAVARTWLSMWQAGTGERLEGVLALDPDALAVLQRPLGPVTIPGAGPVAPDRLVRFLERDQYRLGLEQRDRKELLQDVGAAVLSRGLPTTSPDRRLLTDLAAAAAARHVQLWSARGPEQQVLGRYAVAGALPGDARPFLQVTLDNEAGSKLDTYVKTEVVRSAGCTGTGAETLVRLDNRAPPNGLPPYVRIRADRPDPRPPNGQERVALAVYLAPGSTVDEVIVDGRPAGVRRPTPSLPQTLDAATGGTASVDTEFGHVVVTLHLELPVRRPVVVVVRSTERVPRVEVGNARLPVAGDASYRVEPRRCG